MIRILVTGSRYFTDEDIVFDALSDVFSRYGYGEQFTVVHGGASGADALAGQWATQMGSEHEVFHEIHHPNWAEEGSSAGPTRNRKMVERGADHVLAFYRADAKNVGTRGCVKMAREAGLSVEEFTQEKE